MVVQPDNILEGLDLGLDGQRCRYRAVEMIRMEP